MEDQRPKLSKEHQEAIAVLTESPGWAIFEDLIHNAARKSMLMAATSPVEQRYYQGIFQGMQEVEKMINEAKNLAKEIKDLASKQQ